ncbi:hypothetical protein ACWEOO_38290 [Kribbella sp. NPDC004138]
MLVPESGSDSLALSRRHANGWSSFAYVDQDRGYVNPEDVLWWLLSQGAHLELVRPALATASPDFDVDAEVETWDHVDLKGAPYDDPPWPPSISRYGGRFGQRGDTKARKSRRTLRLPERCVDALAEHLQHQETARTPLAIGGNLAFCTSIGTELDAANVPRAFGRVVDLTPGLSAAEWTPRELRHSFVSQCQGVSIEQISQFGWAEERPGDRDGVPARVAAGADRGSRSDGRDPAPEAVSDSGHERGRRHSQLRLERP